MKESITTQQSPQYERAQTVSDGTSPMQTVSDGTSPVPTETSTSRTSFSRRFAPDAIIAAVAGLVLLVIGLIAITRAGFEGSMRVPVVEVLGFTHTTILGLIEVALGAGLLIAGATASRGAAVFFAGVLGVGAFVGAVQTSTFKSSLALEASFAWLAVITAVVVALSALLIPRFSKQSTVVSAH